MIIYILDLKTGEIAKDEGISEYQLTEGNWSCDCNRELAFGRDSNTTTCLGEKRYIIICIKKEEMDHKWLDKTDVLKRANQGYYKRLNS